MTPLEEALATLGLQAEVELDGRWATLQSDRCKLYVIEVRHSAGYCTWCDDPEARTVEFYRDAITAIQAGLQRAARREQRDENPG